MAGDIISIFFGGGRFTISMIPKLMKIIWDKWDVHGIILLSLFLQIFLIFFAPLRKRSKGIPLRFIWLVYLLADWAANYCVGLISTNQKSHSTKNIRDHLFAFWSPFLLLHLGGPDTITAYALEDNELWLRHLLGLICQTFTAAYIYFLTFQNNPLWIPTLLVFVAGLIKYAERTRALYTASFNYFRQSLVPRPGFDYGKLMEEFYYRQGAGLPAQIVTVPEQAARSVPVETQGWNKEYIEQLEVVQKGFFFYQKFKGVIVDMVFSFDDRLESRDYFTADRYREQVLQVLEIELNFMYESFYTKVTITRTPFGYFCKFVSFTCVVLALRLFILEEKHGLDRFDIGVTYALLYGALALEIVALFMLVVTEYTAILPQEAPDLNINSCFQKFKMNLLNILNETMLVHFFMAKKPKWERIVDENNHYKDYHQLSTRPYIRRWFGEISGYNLMRYSLEKSVEKVPYRLHTNPSIAQFQSGCFKIVLSVQHGFDKVARFCGFGELLDQREFMDNKPFLKELWEFIFDELKRRSDDVWEEDAEMIQSMRCVRGEWVIERELVKECRERLNPFVARNEVSFDQSLIIWHIATCLCYYSGNYCNVLDPRSRNYRDFSMILSDYVIYLLMVQPNLMSSVAGIGQIRFFTTCEEAKRFFGRRRLERIKDPKERLEKACQDIMEVLRDVNVLKRESSISLLFDACRLAKVLNSEELKEKRWRIMAGVWVELLSFSATQCRPTAHVKVLSEGGELISLVWLLMVHLGLGNFQLRDPQVKLLKAVHH